MLGSKIDHNQWPIHRVICIYMKRTRGTGDWLGIQLPKDLQGEVSVGRSVAQLSEHGANMAVESFHYDHHHHQQQKEKEEQEQQ